VNKIQPHSLEIDVPDLDVAAVRDAAGIGLHVVVGANNSGKTRLLRGVEQATLVGAVHPAEHLWPVALKSPFAPGTLAKLSPLHIGWRRNLQAPTEPPQKPSSDRLFLHGTENSSDVAHFWSALSPAVWSWVALRPAVLVPSNRYLEGTASLGENPISLAHLRQWPAVLAGLANSTEPLERDRFSRIKSAMRDITEGEVTLEVRLNRAESLVRVSEAQGERPLEQCGDGLRDLIGILLYASVYDTHDLMLDEPGIRLHPRAQRRLLRHLEIQARSRAIWIATHDGAFVGASGIARRFAIARRSGRAEVVRLVDRASARAAFVALGWLPGDAFLADRVLFCEGPSDRIAFEGAVAWLADEDPTWSGAQVTHLKGSGAVTADSPEVFQRVRLVRQVAPDAKMAVLLDSDNRSTTDKVEIEKSLGREGLGVFWLSVPELENYWLVPSLLERLALRLAEERMAEARLPSSADLTAELERHDLRQAKGSEILEVLVKGWKLSDRSLKLVAAQVCTSLIRDLAPSEALALKEDVRRCFPAA